MAPRPPAPTRTERNPTKGEARSSRELYHRLASAPQGFEKGTSSHRPLGPPKGEAAVLVLFRLQHARSELLLIRRSDREGDPWSGHVAFPGGRREDSDGALAATAVRETKEEVGISLEQLEGPPIPVGKRVPANRPWLHVGVFLSVLKDGEAAPLSLSPEVAEAFWTPLHELRPSQGPVEVLGSEGHLRAEALRFGDQVIWGFTRRVLLDVLGAYGPLLP
ncbi:MAG: CoA pyrophosphatase [Euryarchaeota archaeon]|nr:CoA pyrophosphatase [Euryarchaeota archaeon]MDE1881470.1 CoA pyrophosphatase [Euryarchaeota archaeon]MDE2044231.1 CoA pyrophosphatase [Thermoplasmata archaeon]